MTTYENASITPSRTTASRLNVRLRGGREDAGFILFKGRTWAATSRTSGALGSYATWQEAVNAILEDD